MTLYSDIDKIHDGIGDKIALLIQWVATFFGGFIVGFVEDWRLTLLLLAFTPFLAMGGAIMAKVRSITFVCVRVYSTVHQFPCTMYYNY